MKILKKLFRAKEEKDLEIERVKNLMKEAEKNLVDMVVIQRQIELNMKLNNIFFKK